MNEMMLSKVATKLPAEMSVSNWLEVQTLRRDDVLKPDGAKALVIRILTNKKVTLKTWAGPSCLDIVARCSKPMQANIHRMMEQIEQNTVAVTLSSSRHGFHSMSWSGLGLSLSWRSQRNEKGHV